MISPLFLIIGTAAAVPLFSLRENICNKKERIFRPSPVLQRLCFFDFDDFSAFVVSAILAYYMGSFKFAALGAFAECRGRELPNVGTSCIFSCFRNLSLRYRHDEHLLNRISS